MDNKSTEIEVLKLELNKVSNKAAQFNVSHSDVAAIAGIGYEYLRQIRLGDKPKHDTEENRKLLYNIINVYRKKIRDKIKLMKEFEPNE